MSNMSKYSAEEKAAMLAEARATIAEIELELPARHWPPSESPLEGFRRRANERDAEREQHKLESEVAAIERRIRGMLTDSFKTIVAGMIEAEHAYICESLLPELYNELRDAISDSIRVEIENNYKTAIAELRADVASLKRKGEADVIDLPAFPLRRQN